ncbi:ATP-binding protein [Miltoncostaea oceani]|uniref:ATP-binding protein n=1 Tax=Miltoncostaea oceani TaxID=2843216 RepID=UPI001C3DF4AF|nr:ATP-binding protein [Miltoncostaea oceani]
MSLRIHSLQAINWSHLSPSRISVDGRINVFCGANGSGKSSAMDAIKAVLGARRFGQSRTPAHYLHRSPEGREAATALILLEASGLSPLLGAGSDHGTLCMSVTRRSRRFCLLEGSVGLTAPLEQSMAAFLSDQPRERWLAPERWRREVLEPLGVDASMIRLFELPQGEAHRVMAAKQDDLLAQLLAMLGHQDRLDELDLARASLEDAKREREQVRHGAIAEQRRVASLERAREMADELTELEGEVAVAARTLAGARAQHRVRIETEAQALRERIAEAEEQLQDSEEAVSELRARLRRGAPTLAPAERDESLMDHLRGVCARHTGVSILDERLAADLAERELIEALLGPRRYGLLVDDRAAFDALREDPDLPDGVPLVLTPSLGGGSGIDAYLASVGLAGPMVREEGGVWSGAEWFPDAAAARREDLVGQLGDAERLRATLAAQTAADRSLLRSLERELSEIGPAPHADEASTVEEVSLEQARAELSACESARSRALDRILGSVGSVEVLRARAGEHDGAQARLEEALSLLGEHDAAVERLLGVLHEATSLWETERGRILEEMGERFGLLCEAAGMEGRLVVETSESGRSRIDLLMREHPGRPLKSFFRDGELSGGWRAKTGLLLLLSALTGERSRCPLVMIDEHAASLDEDRAQELGEVFARLADTQGLQFILCAPTKRASESLGWCDAQIGFLAPRAGDEWAQAPLLILRAAGALAA